jgi:glycine betaine catabolism A
MIQEKYADTVSFTLPREYFVSQEVYQAELEKIFFDRWICVGRSAQIDTAGKYFLYEIGDESIIILRDYANTVRAFYNVCRHRGTRMVGEQCGKFARTLQCPYHAWTYSLDGRLVGVPDTLEMPELDKADFPLHKVALTEWEGFLFINLSRAPEPFEQALSQLFEGHFAPWQIGTLRSAQHISYDVDANWKLIVQNYSECYHCPLIHPALNQLSPYKSGENVFTEGAVLGGSMDLTGGAESMSVGGHVCATPLANVSGDDLKRVYYYSLFPNMLLSLHPDYVMYHILQPLAPDRTRVVCEWLFEPETMAQPDFDPSPAVDFWDMTNRQDWHACEISQKGVRSRAYSPGPYHGWQEGLLVEFDKQVRLALGT